MCQRLRYWLLMIALLSAYMLLFISKAFCEQTRVDNMASSRRVGVLDSGGTKAPGYLDPPDDPPVMTQQNINMLKFLTDVDDGFNGLAELRVLYTINWGGSQGISKYLWSEDHNFDVGPPPYSVIPPQLIIGTNTECTPAEIPTVTVQAWESDKGLDPFLDLLIAVGGGALGGALGSIAPGPGTAAGAGAGVALLGGLATLVDEYFDDDNPLTLNVDFATTGLYSQVNLPDGPCADEKTGFRSTTGPAYCSAAPYCAEQVADRYREYARYGVDEHHPFGRSANYASGRFSRLDNALDHVEALALEEGGSGDIESTKQAVRETAVSFASIVASATLGEAITMGMPIGSAQQMIDGAIAAAAEGQYQEAVDLYEQATIVLLPIMFPDFVYDSDFCSEYLLDPFIVLADALTFVDQGQSQAYVPFSICVQHSWDPPVLYSYRITSVGVAGSIPPINQTGSVMVQGGECEDVYGIIDAGIAQNGDFDTLTMIAWSQEPAVYDTCVQSIQVIEPEAVPMLETAGIIILGLILLLVGGFFMWKKGAERAGAA